jgi:predicted restriction endonuclease
LRRTPASVARKLGNFGAFDPTLAARNVSGLTHGSKLDRAIWDEFHQDWSRLISLAHDLRRDAGAPQDDAPMTAPSGPSERHITAKQRLHQTFFRDAVLSSYNSRCCITGLPIRESLVAGHIIPWSVDERRRADPTNGLCLSATLDCLFDSGLLTIGDDLTVCVHRSLLASKDEATAQLVASYHARPMLRPVRFLPDPACLRWHRENVFRAA